MPKGPWNWQQDDRIAAETAESSAKTPVWIPLGIVHNDDYYCRKALMRRVEAEIREGRLELRGYHKDKRWRASDPIPYPYCLELKLDWVAGPSREDGDNPRFSGHKYHCDVSAFHRNNRRDFWTELLIAQADYDRLRTETCEALLREWRNMTVGTAVPDAKPARSEARPPEADAAAEVDRKASKRKGREAEPAAPPRSLSEQTATAIAATQPVPKAPPKQEVLRRARVAAKTGSRRLAYTGELASLMLRLERAGTLDETSDDNIVRRFENEVATKVQDGRSVLRLPQRRHLANQCAKLRTETLERRQQSDHLRHATARSGR